MIERYRRAWVVFERMRRDAIITHNYMTPKDSPSEEEVFCAALAEEFGPKRKGKCPLCGGRGKHGINKCPKCKGSGEALS